MSGFKKGKRRLVVTVAACMFLCGFQSYGETWKVMDGKEYYMDSEDEVKNKWVTDQEDKARYYVGEDGAKCVNMFTPDNHYVGPDGTVLKNFDTYRKRAEKELESFLKKGSFEEGETGGFLFSDLNGDGYSDIAVFDRAVEPERVILTAVWNPEEEEFTEASVQDWDSSEHSVLSRGSEDQQVRLTITGADGNRNYFVLENGGFQFENEWNLEVEKDDWGDPVYYVDGEEADYEDWDRIRRMADYQAGESMAVNLYPLDKEQISQIVNRAPEDSELYLWE